MRSNLLASFRSETSNRTVIIADEGDSVWAYLTQPATLRPERDCWLFNKPSAAQVPDLAPYRAVSLPPPAPASMIDARGVIVDPQSGRWSVRWSENGETATVALDSLDVGLLAMSEPRGRARYLLEEGPWGRPMKT